MTKPAKSWASYSIAIFVAWALVFLLRGQLNSSPDLHDLLLVFIGFFVGWLSATIKFIMISKNS